MKLLVVLQSHSVSDSQKLLGYVDKSTVRYTGTPKIEVSKRCIKSLIHSLNYLVNYTDVEVDLQVFDDHSTEDFIEYLEETLKQCNFSYNLDHLETKGILPSFDALYNYGKLFGEDLVYFPQDDYLYEETCFVEMIDIYNQMNQSKYNGIAKSICVYPYNDPYRYEDHNIVPVRIIQGSKRHWRTSYQTASCFMIEHKMLVEEWDLFEGFYKHPVDPKMEDDTINKLFQERGHVLVTPIPSLALHVQFEREKDPYIDWTVLWNKFKPTDKIELPEKVVLNIGSGKSKLNFPSLSKFTEVSFDADSTLNPDIVGDILELDIIKSESVDVIWASHILEHTHLEDSLGVLQNIRRILKQDGIGIIIVPNLKYFAKYILSGNLHDTVYESEAGPVNTYMSLYGMRKGFMSHKSGYTKEYALWLLQNINIQGYVKEIESNLFILITKNPLDQICVNIEDIMRDFYR